MTNLHANLEMVRGTIADAAARSGRSATDVMLVAVSKTRPAELVAETLATSSKPRSESPSRSPREVTSTCGWTCHPRSRRCWRTATG